ncbi:MAG TPA: polyprenol monophosphomannose synthase [Gaiellaceae bacterium]|nr:polyprenol monophosphomannose synthase [Gaiellaceae bacterium]
MRARIVYATLALAVAGPLLAPGLILALDLSVVPHPHLPTVYWGLPTGTHGGPANRLPIDLLFVLAGHVGAVGLLEKLLLLLSIVFLSGLGMHRLAPSERAAGRYFAGLLYAVNPFVYDRLYTGEWYVLLGYALLPWAFAAFLPVARGEWRAAWRFALLAIVLGVASPHMLVLLGVLAVLETALRARHGGVATLRATALAGVLTVVGSSYWLLARTGVTDLWRHVSSSQLALYQTVSDHRWGILANVLGLYGYWNDAFPIKAYFAYWPVLALAFVALAAFGAGLLRRTPTTWAIAGAAVFGTVLALGTRGPVSGSLFRALLDHVAAARSFREPQKGVALLVFAYAYLGSAAVDSLTRSISFSRRAAAVAFSTATLALPLLYGYRELGGLWGGMHTSSYPAAWRDARAVLDREAASSNTLFLPWHGYFALSFAHGREVANPASSFFDTPMIASRSLGSGEAADNSDPREAALTALLARGPHLSTLGACLAAFGISHVLVAHEDDASRFAFLRRQKDLVVERSWPGMTLFRNTHPTGLVLQTRGTPTEDPCAAHVAPLALRVHSPAHLELAAAPARGTRLVLAESFSSAWRLDGASGSPLAGGAETAFTSDGRSTSMSFATAAWNERAYAIGLLAFLLVLVTGRLGGGRRATARAASPLSGSPRVWVVLPTYNEAANLERMLDALRRALAAHDATILVVDDASPDGTGEIADRAAEADPRVRVLHRRAKQGLGPAYAAGFRAALDGGADLVVQMDCDLSHDPHDVPRLVEAAHTADVVLGSRYVRGGGVRDWGLVRRVLSRGGCLYARLVLGVPYADLTGGFKCFRRSALLRLDPATLQASGYAFQIETTYRAHRLGLAVREVPIVFRDRELGSSKMSPAIALEALLLVPRLRVRGGAQPAAAAVEGQAAAATL